MTYNEHVLKITEEECSEIAQRISKALRFGLEEVQLGQELNNAQRIMYEYTDLVAMIGLCQTMKLLPKLTNEEFEKGLRNKLEKVKTYTALSKVLGKISD